MFKWFSRLFRIVKTYDETIKHMYNRIDKIEAISKSAIHTANLSKRIIEDRTDAHIDVHYKSPHNIILIGRYRNMDYVQCYNIQSDDFVHMVHMLKDMEHCHIATIDSPPQIKAALKHEFKL